MIVKNNYNECLTNLACSIRKYFELDYKHNTLPYIDEILEKNNPENVVLILFDGMGSNILDRTLEKDDFFIKNRLKTITTVFPATTTSATTSIQTGLNPIEHGWLGWHTYLSSINKTVSLFRNNEKGKDEPCKEYLEIKPKFEKESIVEEINRIGKYTALSLFPFKDYIYKDLNNMIQIIKTETSKKGKKFIYAYDEEPDHTMHDYGPNSIESKTLIKIRTQKIEELCKNLQNTLVIIIADHGHLKCDNISLNNYPEILNMLERTTSIEQRTVSFKVKDAFKEDFKTEFNNLFSNYFTLYEKEDIIKSNLFGDGTPDDLFEDAIGDFIAIAENSNKSLLTNGDNELVSQHAGYTDDEVLIPLIIYLAH